MRTLVMADIHGEYTVMQRVLEAADYRPDKDQLILLGDYIDRGEESSQVVAAVKELIANGAIALLGNHEKMMIDALQSEDYRLWDVNGGGETRRSYHSQEQMHRDAEFFASLPLYYETDQYIFVHAGIKPGVPMDQQESVALLWARPEYFRFYKGKTIVCGHTPVQSIMENEMYAIPYKNNDVIFIDTGMGWGQRLTIVQLPERYYWQSWRWDKEAGMRAPKKFR